MIRMIAPLVLAGFLGLGVFPPAQALSAHDDAWLHIRVVESGEDGEKVSVNLPINLIEQILPHVKSGSGGFSEGKVRLGSTDLDGTDVRAILKAVSGAKDGEFITVEGPRETVRVAKAARHLLIDVTDGDEKVRVRVPFSVLDAMTADTADDELNVLAAVRALARAGEQELITVEDTKSVVRIWVDRKANSD